MVEANRATTFTHESGGNVLTRTVTDTAVMPHVARTWSYTYDSFGRVLTEDGPRTNVSDVTTYSYYDCTTAVRCGQVKTITDAARSRHDLRHVQRKRPAHPDHRCKRLRQPRWRSTPASA